MRSYMVNFQKVLKLMFFVKMSRLYFLFFENMQRILNPGRKL